MVVSSQPHWPRVVGQIGKPLVLIVVFAFGISLFHRLDPAFRFIALPALPISLFGGAVGIFLGFRTNSAYGRWWEARTLWGALINQSRSWARQITAFVSDTDERRELIYLQIGYVHALRCHLRLQAPWNEISKFLPHGMEAELRKQKNVPAAILHSMGNRVTALSDIGQLSELRLQRLDITLSELTNVQGGCERIKNTPLPRQYDYYPELFIYLYCVILPLGIVQDLSFMTPAITALSATVFLILNRIGKNLEDPFEDTVYAIPLLAMSRTVETNLRQTLDEEDLPAPVPVIKGVLP
jgi:ion channel-forming bestrophin family protein